MAYVAPTIGASSQTFATLKTLGVRGYIQGVVAAQTETDAQVELTDKLLNKVQCPQVLERLANIVDSYLHGDPVAVATVDTELADISFAFKSIATAVDEIGALVDANAGTLAFTTGDPLYPKYKRTLP